MPRQEWVGIEPMGEVFLLTFLFIGLVRDARFTDKWRITPASISTAETLAVSGIANVRTVEVLPRSLAQLLFPDGKWSSKFHLSYATRTKCIP
jgi:hypothetical protein